MTSKTSDSSAKGFAQHASLYAIGNVLRQLAGFLMLPVYTRYLSPADYGAVGLLTLALALLEPFFGARLAQAIPRFYFLAKGEESQQSVVVSALALTGAVSAVTAAFIWLFSGNASDLLFGTREYALATALFGLNMLTQPIEHTGMTFIRMQQRSLLFFVISLVKLFVQISLNLLLVIYLNLGVVGVILSGVIASGAFGLGLTAYTLTYNKPRIDTGMIWKMLAFSWPLWFAGLAGLYTGSSSRIFLRFFGSLDAVGLIELGSRFAGIIGLLVWSPFSQHWEVVSYKLYSEGRAEKPFQTAFIIVSTLLLIVGLGVSIFATPTIHIMADESFHGAAPTVPLLTLGVIFSSLAGFFSFAFFASDNTKLVSHSQYFMALVITVLFLLLIPPFKEVGAALAQCIASGITLYVIYRVSLRYFDPGVRLTSFWISLLVSVASFAACSTLVSSDNIFIEVGAKSIIYLGTCGTLIWLAARHANRYDPAAVATISRMVRQAIGGALARRGNDPR